MSDNPFVRLNSIEGLTDKLEKIIIEKYVTPFQLSLILQPNTYAPGCFVNKDVLVKIFLKFNGQHVYYRYRTFEVPTYFLKNKRVLVVCCDITDQSEITMSHKVCREIKDVDTITNKRYFYPIFPPNYFDPYDSD